MERKTFIPKTISEDIVISGMSGRFPESDSVDEFADNLYNNVDMITLDNRRWPTGYHTMTFIWYKILLFRIELKNDPIWAS